MSYNAYKSAAAYSRNNLRPFGAYYDSCRNRVSKDCILIGYPTRDVSYDSIHSLELASNKYLDVAHF